ncbi:acyl carrier protein, partial [Kitasatospora sp. Root107]|uniref:acyl carrier protein n=1 Tax=Kitasatospora sp. Root107 TaxID=1736424 RepID=UPI00138F0A8D
MTRQQLTDWLREYLADLLDVTPEQIGTDIPLEQLGVDSATTLVLVLPARRPRTGPGHVY